MKQLNLTKKQLRLVGFTRKVVKASQPDGTKKPRTIYRISIINGSIYCNVDEPVYKWYIAMSVGDASNHICMDIYCASQMYGVLDAMGAKNNLIMGL